MRLRSVRQHAHPSRGLVCTVLFCTGAQNRGCTGTRGTKAAGVDGNRRPRVRAVIVRGDPGAAKYRAVWPPLPAHCHVASVCIVLFLSRMMIQLDPCVLYAEFLTQCVHIYSNLKAERDEISKTLEFEREHLQRVKEEYARTLLEMQQKQQAQEAAAAILAVAPARKRSSTKSSAKKTPRSRR